MEMKPQVCPLCGVLLSLDVQEDGLSGVTSRIERHMVTDALRVSQNDRKAAADLLHISIHALGRIIRKHGIIT